MLSSNFADDSSRALVGAEHGLGRRGIDGPIDTDQAEVGVAVPQLACQLGERRTPTVVEATHEQHVDRSFGAVVAGASSTEPRRVGGAPPRFRLTAARRRPDR